MKTTTSAKLAIRKAARSCGVTVAAIRGEQYSNARRGIRKGDPFRDENGLCFMVDPALTFDPEVDQPNVERLFAALRAAGLRVTWRGDWCSAIAVYLD